MKKVGLAIGCRLAMAFSTFRRFSMKRIMLLTTLLSVLFSTQNHATEWSYDEASGPETWVS